VAHPHCKKKHDLLYNLAMRPAMQKISKLMNRKHLVEPDLMTLDCGESFHGLAVVGVPSVRHHGVGG